MDFFFKSYTQQCKTANNREIATLVWTSAGLVKKTQVSFAVSTHDLSSDSDWEQDGSFDNAWDLMDAPLSAGHN